MGSEHSTRRQSGFTLVELLIVAIILAILAAIIIPQFASTTTDAQESALRADVAAMRAAMDLYRQQHGEYPGTSLATGGTCTGGAAGTGAALSQAALLSQLTRYSNLAGQTCTLPLATFPFGPYLQIEDIPNNPISNLNTVVIQNTGDLAMAPDAGSNGWKYDALAGKFIVNITGNDSQGVPYSSY